MSLSGCSSRVIIKTQEVPILPPDSMLVSPCGITASGETLRTLGSAKIADESCITQHKHVLLQYEEWKQDKLKLYKQEK